MNFSRLFPICIFVVSFLNSSAQPGLWTWMKGDSTTSSAGYFGTQGVFSDLNEPPAAYEACEWKDADGNLWLLGGLNASYQEYADLWKYNISLNQWAWIKGPGIASIGGVYGTQGIPSPANYPGSRGWGAATWVGSDGVFWLYGGWGTDVNQSWNALNDLWKYDINTNEWTWMHGSTVGQAPAVHGTQGVPAPQNTPGARGETNASWVDDDGNLWLFGGWTGSFSRNDLWKFDVAIGQWTWISGSSAGNQPGVYGVKGVSSPLNRPGARAAYSKSRDASGNLWLFGGYDPATGYTYNDVWRYHLSQNEWTWMSGDNFGSPSGSVSANCDPEVSNAPSGRHETRASWSDCQGNFWLFGGNTLSGLLSDLWTFNITTLEWSRIDGNNQIGLPGHFGIKGVPGPSNYPRARWGGIAWLGEDCRLWLWGGQEFNVLNDLWVFAEDPDCPANLICNTSCFNVPGVPLSSDTTVCEKFCIDFYDVSFGNPVAWEWSFEGGTPAVSTLQNPAGICYQDPGTYDVQLVATDAAGNTDTLEWNDFIVVFENPFAPSVTQDNNTLISSPAFSYQWQLNGTDIPGATNEEYEISESGVYTVIITNENGCVAQSSIKAFYVGTTEAAPDYALKLFPNPSSGPVSVFLSGLLLQSDLKIMVKNALGQQVYEMPVPTATSAAWTIDLSDQPAGFYTLELKGRETLYCGKILRLPD